MVPQKAASVMSERSYPLPPPLRSLAAAVLAVLKAGAIVDIDPESPDRGAIDTLIDLGWPCMTVPINDPDGHVRAYGFHLRTRSPPGRRN